MFVLRNAISSVALTAALAGCETVGPAAPLAPGPSDPPSSVPASSRGTTNGPSASAAASSLVDDGSVWIAVAPGSGPLAELLRDEVSRARASSLKPIVYVGQTACKPCGEVVTHRRDPVMLDALRGTYVIEISIDDWKSADLAPLGLESEIIPVFYRVDDAGRATGRKINGTAWDEDTPENMAPPLRAFFAGR